MNLAQVLKGMCENRDLGILVPNWQEANGTSWVLASVSGSLAAQADFETDNGVATHGSIVAFKVRSRMARRR
jgi:hypothetical protein